MLKNPLQVKNIEVLNNCVSKRLIIFINPIMNNNSAIEMMVPNLLYKKFFKNMQTKK